MTEPRHGGDSKRVASRQLGSLRTAKGQSPSPWTRRNFLKWLGWAAAVPGLTAARAKSGLRSTKSESALRPTKSESAPRPTDSESAPRPTESVDVAIIGAGLAGLTAARDLRSAGIERVRVLEARDRVGGRTLNQPMAGGRAIAEAGGQWVGPTQDAVIGLARELGVETFTSHAQGETVEHISGDSSLLAVPDYLYARARLDRMAKEVPLASPWTASRALEWDRITVQDWLDANLYTEAARTWIGFEVSAPLGPPDEVSFLYFLFYIHSAGSLEHLATHAQEQRFVGGAQQVALRLSEALLAEDPGLVETSAPVQRIEWTDSAAHLRVGSRSLETRHVIVAMMPADAARIAFDPPLPAQRQELHQAWETATGSKFHCAYPSPFWRAKGQSGMAISDDTAIGMTFDNSPPDGSVGVLVSFVSDESLLPPDASERKKLVIDSLVSLFGEEAAHPLDYIEKRWSSDPWTSGCVSPLGPGRLTESGPAIRETVGAIHWAGTETSERWCGYMDGAVRSGHRVALEILASMKLSRGRAGSRPLPHSKA